VSVCLHSSMMVDLMQSDTTCLIATVNRTVVVVVIVLVKSSDALTVS